MNFASIKEKWRSYSTNKRWLIGGAGVLILAAAAGAGTNGDDPQRGGYAASPGTAPGGFPTSGDMSGNYPSPAPAMPAGAMIAGAAPAAGSTDVTSAWEARERSNDIAARGFDQMIRDQTDLRDERTGEITTDVPNDVANPAMESGAYTAAPAADVVPPTTDSAPE